MKRPLTCTAALALLIGLTAPMTASAQANRQQQQVSREQALERANLSRTSELIGMTVFARGGAELGEVHDIVVDPVHGVASFAIIEPSAELDLGDRLLPLPFKVLRIDPTQRDRLITDVPRSRIDARRGFVEGDAPDFTDRRYVRQVYEHFEIAPYWQGQQRDGNLAALKLSALKGEVVNNAEDDKLGEVDDVLIDMEEGRLVYLLLARGNRLSLVPFGAVQIEAQDDDDHKLVLDANERLLERVSFRNNQWPNVADEQWARNLHQQFGEEPYWEVFGYQRFEAAEWLPGSAYNKLYDLNQEQRIEGEVIRVERFGLREGGREGVRMVVRDEQNRTHVVHLAPASFIRRMDIDLDEGDDVRVTGSRVTFQGQPVILARLVVEDDDTHQLRNAQGEPLWDPGARQRDTRPRADDDDDLDDLDDIDDLDDLDDDLEDILRNRRDGAGDRR